APACPCATLNENAYGEHRPDKPGRTGECLDERRIGDGRAVQCLGDFGPARQPARQRPSDEAGQTPWDTGDERAEGEARAHGSADSISGGAHSRHGESSFTARTPCAVPDPSMVTGPTPKSPRMESRWVNRTCTVTVSPLTSTVPSWPL